MKIKVSPLSLFLIDSVFVGVMIPGRDFDLMKLYQTF